MYYSYFNNFNIVERSGTYASFNKNQPWLTTSLISFQHNKIYLITKGKCSVKIGEREYIGTPGSMFFIPAFTVHGYHSYTDEPFEHYFLHFDLYPSKTKLSDVFALPYMINTDNEKSIYDLFDKYISLNKSQDITDLLITKATLLQIVIYYIEKSNVDTVSLMKKNDICLNTLFSYIEKNLHRNITNSELASIAKMNPNHLIKFFKRETGLTPAKYVTMQKMEYAKMLLDQTELSISGITERIGIEYVSHFSKLFKTFYGISPQKYRKLPELSSPVSYVYDKQNSGEIKS